MGKKLIRFGKDAKDKVDKSIDNLPQDENGNIDIKKTADQVAVQVKKAAKNAVDNVTDYAAKTKSAFEQLPRDKNGNIDVKAAFDQMGSSALDAIEQNMKDQKESKAWTQKVLKEIEEEKKPDNISQLAAVDLMYLVMNADQDVTQDEKDQFAKICDKINSDINPYHVMKYMDHNMNGSISQQIDKILASTGEDEKTVHPKLLLWDLIAIAYSDGDYSLEEKELIRQICDRLKIDGEIQIEMEQSYQTMIALQKEKEFVEKSDYPTEQRSGLFKQLDHRKEIVEHSIEALIAD